MSHASRKIDYLTLIALLATAVGCRFTPQGQNYDGVRQFQTGNYQGAVSHFQQALALNPRNADAYYNLGAVYQRVGDQQKNQDYYREAENLYRQCLAIDANHAECFRGYAVLLGQTNRRDDAFNLLKQWGATHPNSPEPRIELARLSQEYGDKPTAESYLQQALQVDPYNARAWAGLGKLREDAGDFAQALANYQRSYQLNPNIPGVPERVASLQRSGVYAPPTPTPLSPGGTRMVNAPGPMRRF